MPDDATLTYTVPGQTQLLNKLWALQQSAGYISDAAIDQIATELAISAIEVEGVVSFYHFFHRKPTGKYTIYLNNSIIADCKGFSRIKEAFERETGAAFGSVDRTGEFGLFLTPCIGLSDQEPAALINFYPFTNLNAIKVKEIISKLRNGASVESICDSPDDHIRYTPPDNKSIFFKKYTTGEALVKLPALGVADVIAEIKQSELTGRGTPYYIN